MGATCKAIKLAIGSWFIKLGSYFDTCRLKSIKIDNHKKSCDRFLSISDICRLISIKFSTFEIIDMLRPAKHSCPVCIYQVHGEH